MPRPFVWAQEASGVEDPQRLSTHIVPVPWLT